MRAHLCQLYHLLHDMFLWKSKNKLQFSDSILWLNLKIYVLLSLVGVNSLVPLHSSVADPEGFDADVDPDPTFYVDADPDPNLLS